MSFTLFDGAVNQDTETPVLYNEMSKGDYIGTAWINFFNKEDTNLSGTDFKLGRYIIHLIGGIVNIFFKNNAKKLRQNKFRFDFKPNLIHF